MRILHTVQGYMPYVGGSEEVVRKISERLVEKGHEVTVFTSIHPDRKGDLLNGVRLREFDLSGCEAKGITGDRDSYVDAVKHGEFDVMLNYAAQTWATDTLLPHLTEIDAVRILAPCGYGGLRKRIFARYYANLHEYLREYEALVYHSMINQDYKYGISQGLSNGFVIPNYADEREFDLPDYSFRDKYKVSARHICLSVSNHFREKGHDFVINAFLNASLHDAVLVIVGNRVSRFNVHADCYLDCRFRELMNNGKIRLLHDMPRRDVVSAFHCADLFLFGSKIECSPLVIFEAMASKTPWISTDVGNVSELPGGVLVTTPREMSTQIRSLISDPMAYSDLSESGFRNWRERFSLGTIADKYEALYSFLVANERKPMPRL